MVAAVALLALAIGGGALAHTGGSTGYAAVSIERGTVRYTLTLWPAAMPPAVADSIARTHAGDAAARDQLLGVVADKVTMEADGRRCQAAPAARQPGPQAQSITLSVDFTCGDPVRALRIRDDLFDVFSADYHTLARIDTPARTAQFAFTPESRQTRVDVSGTTAGGVLSFVRLGVEHILGGWDHLLFLLGLLLRGGSWLSLAKIVTAFTLAHSVTLALAALDIVVLPDRLVEAVIALSIAYVAAENLFLRPLVSRRWLVSFCFGLVHGFGFSSVLRELGLPASGLALSLLGFNVGVELGQALVVAVALPALMLVRRTRWEPRLIWTSSMAILVVGVALFVERLLS